MDPTDPYSHQTMEGQSAEPGGKLNISPVPQIEPQDAHWLRMDPSLTRAVLAKTEEELLGSLAALMRNKVEHEQSSRRFAQIQIDAQQAQHEFEVIRAQIRRAEEEVATRLNEQSRINEEIVRVRQELAALREGYLQQSDAISSLKSEATQAQQALEEANRNLQEIREATETHLTAHRETAAQLAQLRIEKASLEENFAPLRDEVIERIKAREDLIAQEAVLRQHLSDLVTSQEQQAAEFSELGVSGAEFRNELERLRDEYRSLVSGIATSRQTITKYSAEKEQLNKELIDLRQEIANLSADRQCLQQSRSEEQSQVSDLLARKEDLQQVVAEGADRQRALRAEIVALQSRLDELTKAVEKAGPGRSAEGLPLLFGAEACGIAPEWDPYPLESEFHTDELLDAKKIAELVSLLPGLEGCLIVKNQGPVLASQMPERLHAHLKVPDRNYHLLFDCLEKKVEEYNLQNARLATFDLGEEALTVAQANHAFVLVNHRHSRLRPGLPGKLASIVSEVAKMYP